MTDSLTHVNKQGEACMVDVGGKKETERTAVVSCEIRMKPETLALLRGGNLKKGDAVTVARTAAILAAKKTSELIPMCHPIPVNEIKIDFSDLDNGHGLLLTAKVSSYARTGVEMEAFSAASVGALTVYDMAKAVDPGMVISEMKLVRKTGGKSDYVLKGLS